MAILRLAMRRDRRVGCVVLRCFFAAADRADFDAAGKLGLIFSRYIALQIDWSNDVVIISLRVGCQSTSRTTSE